MVGFGSCHYVFESGREGDWFLTGFSARKQALVVYLMSGLERHKVMLESLGPHKTGKGCLYLKRLSDIDLNILEKLIRESIQYLKK